MPFGPPNSQSTGFAGKPPPHSGFSTPTSAPTSVPTSAPNCDPYIELLQRNCDDTKRQYEQLLSQYTKQNIELGQLRERTRVVDELSRMQHNQQAKITITFPNGETKDVFLPTD